MKDRLKKTTLGFWLQKISGRQRHVRRLARRYGLYLRNRKYLKPTAGLKDRFKGKRAFILACGPSINTQDLRPLAGEFCISVSNFFVHPDFKTIKPEYHIFAEWHTPITYDQMVAWLRDAEQHFAPGQKVVLALNDRHLVEDNGLFKNQAVYYYSLRDSDGPIRVIDFGRRIPSIQTVAHQAIYLALFSGASEVYLLGCDHDTILHLGESRHFYEEDKNMLMKKGLSEWTHPNWLAHFKAYVRLWEIYLRIRDYASRTGVKIFNATPGSLLDVFPRLTLNDVLTQK